MMLMVTCRFVDGRLILCEDLSPLIQIIPTVPAYIGAINDIDDNHTGDRQKKSQLKQTKLSGAGCQSDSKRRHNIATSINIQSTVSVYGSRIWKRRLDENPTTKTHELLHQQNAPVTQPWVTPHSILMVNPQRSALLVFAFVRGDTGKGFFTFLLLGF